VGAITALAAIGALVFTSQQVGLTQQGQITDRFAKAVEQLGQAGPEKVGVRLARCTCWNASCATRATTSPPWSMSSQYSYDSMRFHQPPSHRHPVHLSRIRPISRGQNHQRTFKLH
jgi:hypothetical protein